MDKQDGLNTAIVQNQFQLPADDGERLLGVLKTQGNEEAGDVSQTI